MMPKKTWNGYKTVAELKELASRLGDHNANWVEQVLEWAQRIHNGESWENVCDKKDTANWYRLVVWKNGYARLVGGAVEGQYHGPASDVSLCEYLSYFKVIDTVPLVVLYTK